MKKMKSTSPRLVVMVLSENGDAAPDDADDLLRIPCSLESLLQHVQDLLAKKKFEFSELHMPSGGMK